MFNIFSSILKLIAIFNNALKLYITNKYKNSIIYIKVYWF